MPQRRHDAGRHAKSSEVGPKQTEEVGFAHEVLDKLEQGRVGHVFVTLVVVA